jgi:hypothetical protein
MLGFGLAGLSRRWLVYPAALIWPSSLASTVLFRALHEPQDTTPANGWTITRYRYFVYGTLAAFVWFWFPDYIWTSLSTFAFVTWIAPNNQKVNTLFGVSANAPVCGTSASRAYVFIDELGTRTAADLSRLDPDQLRRVPPHHTLLRDLQRLCRCGVVLPLPLPHPVLHQCVVQCLVSRAVLPQTQARATHIVL